MRNYTKGSSHRSYEGEIWHSIDIEPFNDVYDVSNYGRIRSHHNNKYGKINNYKILKPQIDGPGYSYIILHKNKQLKPVRIHRLVATYFIPNPENKPEVNHKDGNKTNNCVDNLEWCTRKENEKHAWATGLKTFNELQRETSRKNLEIAREKRRQKYEII